MVETKTYICKICGKELPSKQALGGHMFSHKQKNDKAQFVLVVKPKKNYNCKYCGKELSGAASLAGHVSHCPKKNGRVPDLSAQDIASALLLKVTHAINNDLLQISQIKEARKQIANLTEKLSSITQERDRVLKAHNALVLESKRHQTELPDVANLMRIAKMRPEDADK